VSTDGDYEVLKDITRRVVERVLKTILERVREKVKTPMTLTDAAFAVLSQAGGGPLSLKDIMERAQQRGLLDGQASGTALASALLHDARFDDLGNSVWVLAPTEDPETDFEPTIYAGTEASFWRIHFPREFWPQAYQSGLLGVGFNDNPND